MFVTRIYLFLLFFMLTLFFSLAKADAPAPKTVQSPDDNFWVSVMTDERELQSTISLLPKNFKTYTDDYKKVHLWAGTLAQKSIWVKKVVILYSRLYQTVYNDRPTALLTTKWGLLIHQKVNQEFKDYKGNPVKDTLIKEMIIPGDISTYGLSEAVSFDRFITDRHLDRKCHYISSYTEAVQSESEQDVECYYMVVPPYYYTLEDLKNRDQSYKYLSSWSMKDFNDARSTLASLK
ncbi:MAG: hypothetical protein WCG27_02465 [Pseudomonadota bacterium]